MSVVLLRKLTEKSTLKFGKYADLTVLYLLEHQKKNYLRWVYFNSSNITFTDEILDKLNITQEFRFDKPNKNEDLFKKFSDFIDSFRTEKSREISDKKVLKKNKAILVRNQKFDKTFFSKSSLQKRNHGH